MIKNIKGKKIKVLYKEEKMEFPDELREKIDEHWEKVLQDNPNLWNGEVSCVTKCEENENEITIVCQKSDYAHYLFDERVGCPLEYGCFNLAAGALLETVDGYFVVGELDKNTSYPFCMQLPGGNVDKKDIHNGFIDINGTISREVMEEVNIDIDSEQVLCYEPMYLAFPPDNQGYQVIGKAKLRMTKQQMQDYYAKYLEYLRENGLEVELGRLHFLKSKEDLDKLENPKRGYLRGLIELASRENQYGQEER